MQQPCTIFYWISSLFILSTTSSFAQTILTVKDSLLFIQCAKLEKAYPLFKPIESFKLLDTKSACKKATLHFQNRAFDKAYELINSYPAYLKDNIKVFDLHYFTALISLTKGNKNDAFKRLKAIHAESLYKDDAEKLLAHFFKPEEED